MNRNDLITYIKELHPTSDSNLKFMNLMKTRLLNVGIPLEDAMEIIALLTFDFSNVPEDDDTLSEIATEYADYCKLAYDKLKLHGLTHRKLYDRIFNRVYLKVEH
jgi:hypothetical protein